MRPHRLRLPQSLSLLVVPLIASALIAIGCGSGVMDPIEPVAAGSDVPRYVWVGGDDIREVHVEWSAPEGGEAVTGYRIRWSTPERFEPESMTLPPTQHSVNLQGLVTRTPYVFQVVALHASGESDPAFALYGPGLRNNYGIDFGIPGYGDAPLEDFPGNTHWPRALYWCGNPNDGYTRIRWREPEDMAGLSAFEVRCRRYDEQEWHSSTYTAPNLPYGSGDLLDHSVGGLIRNTPYFATVTARYTDGSSMTRSMAFHGTLMQASRSTPPCQPERVRVVPIGGDAVRLTCDGSPGGGPITYTITCRYVDLLTGLSAEELKSPGVVLSDMKNGSYYQITVTAVRYGIKSDEKFWCGYVGRDSIQ